MELTSEQQKDVQSRLEEFKRRHESNVKELEVDFAVIPKYVPVGPNVWGTEGNVQIIDTKYLPKPSPFKES